MEKPKKDIPAAFCVAPWLHAHVGAGGERRLCCISHKAPERFAKLPWNDFKNSDYMKKTRKKMLNNEVPVECIPCELPNRTGIYRDHLNHLYQEELQEILNSTNEDGSTDHKVKFLDYRSNLCNLKCRTCAPVNSSAHHSHVIKNFNSERQRLFGDLDKISPKETFEFFKSNYAVEALSFCETEDIDRVYFAGGEPFLEPSHLPFLKKLIEHGGASQVELSYNTNLSYPVRMLEEWIQLAHQFKKIQMMVSIDGAGPVAEYIREGLDLEVFERNLDFLIQKKSENVQVVLDITFTSLNLFFMKEFAEFALSKRLPTTAKLMVDGARSFPLLRCEIIPDKIKKSLLTQWNDFYFGLHDDHKNLVGPLNITMDFYRSTTSKDFSGLGDILLRLQQYEKMHPDSRKFFDILKTKPLGTEWFNHLQSEKN